MPRNTVLSEWVLHTKITGEKIDCCSLVAIARLLPASCSRDRRTELLQVHGPKWTEVLQKPEDDRIRRDAVPLRRTCDSVALASYPCLILPAGIISEVLVVALAQVYRVRDRHFFFLPLRVDFYIMWQEAVSRGFSFAWGKCENKELSQEHMMERLEMAVSELELALERSIKLPITDVSLLQRRQMIKCAYVQARELLHKHKQQAAPVSQEQMSTQGMKRKRWIFQVKNVPITSLASLSMDDVRRFEWFADCAGKFVRDVESGCSLRQYTFCNPIARHLLEGKTLMCHLDQGTQVENVYIWPTYSEERGVERAQT
ncbi:hypothetical protein U9M48_011527 [Paspalum notatum var. saurae]|uniref:Uncharacterized protein n=1 Tax=Paspalum notatum var. saurae TaxID=547442 RepID=A0AAQ3SVL4_PASNO